MNKFKIYNENSAVYFLIENWYFFSPELCGLLGEVLAGTESPGTTPVDETGPPWSLLCCWAGLAVEL